MDIRSNYIFSLRPTRSKGRSLVIENKVKSNETLYECLPFATVALPGFCNSCYQSTSFSPPSASSSSTATAASSPSSSSVMNARCGGCSTVYYCSRTCQRNDWPIHRYLCSLYRKCMTESGGKPVPTVALLAAAVLRQIRKEGYSLLNPPSASNSHPIGEQIFDAERRQFFTSAPSVIALEANQTQHPVHLIKEYTETAKYIMRLFMDPLVQIKNNRYNRKMNKLRLQMNSNEYNKEIYDEEDEDTDEEEEQKQEMENDQGHYGGTNYSSSSTDYNHSSTNRSGLEQRSTDTEILNYELQLQSPLKSGKPFFITPPSAFASSLQYKQTNSTVGNDSKFTFGGSKAETKRNAQLYVENLRHTRLTQSTGSTSNGALVHDDNVVDGDDAYFSNTNKISSENAENALFGDTLPKALPAMKKIKEIPVGKSLQPHSNAKLFSETFDPTVTTNVAPDDPLSTNESTAMNDSGNDSNTSSQNPRIFKSNKMVTEEDYLIGVPTLEECVTLLCKLHCNTYTIWDNELRPVGIGIYPFSSLMNHSCDPNCIILYIGTKQVIRTIKPLQKGEELQISYIDSGLPTPLRLQELRENYFFECDCSRCANFVKYERLLLPTRALTEEEKQAVKEANYTAQAKQTLSNLLSDIDSIVSNIHQRAITIQNSLDPTVPFETLHISGNTGESEEEYLKARNKENLATLATATPKLDDTIQALTATYLPLEPFNIQDSTSMGVRCTRVHCKGSHIILPTRSRKYYGVDNERYVQPVPASFAGVCSGCGKLLRTDDRLASIAVEERISKLITLQKAGAPAKVLLAAGVPLFAESKARLHSCHIQFTTLANTLMNAAIDDKNFTLAETFCNATHSGYDFMYPLGHPLPALQYALHGKLCNYNGQYTSTVQYIRKALKILMFTHDGSPNGPGKVFLQELHNLRNQAEVSAVTIADKDVAASLTRFED